MDSKLSSLPLVLTHPWALEDLEAKGRKWRRGLFSPPLLLRRAYPSWLWGKRKKRQSSICSFVTVRFLCPCGQPNGTQGLPCLSVPSSLWWSLEKCGFLLTALCSISPICISLCPTCGLPPASLQPPKPRTCKQEKELPIFLSQELERIIPLTSHYPVIFSSYKNFLLTPLPGCYGSRRW